MPLDFLFLAQTDTTFKKMSRHACKCIIGPQGFEGTQGADGESGCPGKRGRSGFQGMIGEGTTGPQGYVGKTGDHGCPGKRGKPGRDGFQGLIGEGTNGPQGDKGETGDHGCPGKRGKPGRDGVQGLTGRASSVPGPQGQEGHDGCRGKTGKAGRQGMIGLQGDSGDIGVQGTYGNQGAQGNDGNPGPQGHDGGPGAQGFDGNIGVQGSDGNPGVQGFDGMQGSDGNRGVQGYDGNIGAQGFDGVQGHDGNRGMQGYDGKTGTQGNDGKRGIQGYDGSFGQQGYDGNRGIQGYDGNRGAQGYKGSQGHDGNRGFEGYQGPKAQCGGHHGSMQFNANDDLDGTDYLICEEDKVPTFALCDIIPQNPENGVKVYCQQRAGRHQLIHRSVIGMQYNLQPCLCGNRVMWWSATSRTTPSTFGFGTAGTGNTTARAVAPDSLVSGSRRLGFVSNGNVNSSAGSRHGRLEFYMTDSKIIHGGFFYVCRFAIASSKIIPSQRQFVGMWGSASVLSAADPSSQQVAMIGFGVDSGDSTWSFMHSGTNEFTASITNSVMTVTSASVPILLNKPIFGFAKGTTPTAVLSGDGTTGTYMVNVSQTVKETKVVQFGDVVKDPLPDWLNPRDTSILYEARIYSAPGSGIVSWSLQDLSSEELVVEDTVETDLPPMGTLFAPQVWINNGYSGGQVGIDIATQYIETDF